MLGFKEICLPLGGEGGGASRRMRWKAGNQREVCFTALNAPTPHQSLRDSFRSRGSRETPQHSQENRLNYIRPCCSRQGRINFEINPIIFGKDGFGS